MKSPTIKLCSGTIPLIAEKTILSIKSFSVMLSNAVFKNADGTASKIMEEDCKDGMSTKASSLVSTASKIYDKTFKIIVVGKSDEN